MSKPLRAFLCCQQDLRLHSVPAYRFWASIFRSALAEAGHVCLEAPGCDWAEGLLPRAPEDHARWKQLTWDRAFSWLVQEHRRKPVDLFLSYLYPGQVEPSAVGQIRDLGIPCVNFFCDNVRLFRKIPDAFRAFDLNWVPEVRGCELYERAGFPFLFAPMPCWVERRFRSAPAAETLPTTFVGTRDEQRERLFSEAIRLGLSIDLRGTGWAGEPEAAEAALGRTGLSLLANQVRFIRSQGWGAFFRKARNTVFPAVPIDFDFRPWVRERCNPDSYWQVLRESVVCVGVNRYPSLRYPASRPDTYSRLRDLEGPMVGSAYVTEDAPELASLYDVGNEIEVYRNPAELVEKVKQLQRDPARRRLMRRSAQRRALADHTIEKTLDKITSRLGL